MRLTYDVVIMNGQLNGEDQIFTHLTYKEADALVDSIRMGDLPRELKRCTGVYMRPRLYFLRGEYVPSYARRF